MENKILVVFDDTNEKSEVIKDVIGEKGFSDVIVKKHRLDFYYKKSLSQIFKDYDWRLVNSTFEFGDFSKKVEILDSNIKILHCFSNFIISDVERLSLAFKKLNFIEKKYAVISDKKTVALMFNNSKEYASFLKNAVSENTTIELADKFDDIFECEGVTNIGNVSNFIQCIAGNFDARYFNSLKGDEYTLVKTSSNKKKIHAEYQFYHLLPEDMKFWFVMPFNYVETENSASYTMERLHMTDLAIKWVHGSITEDEFSKILDKYFYFFNSRHQKNISKAEYDEIANELYVEKVCERIENLKKLSQFQNIANLMKSNQDFKDIDSVLSKYLELKQKIESRNKYPLISVIGHGDPCFANVMYNKSTQILKFIDPKGALTEEELWTNPYYDIAKLSHSVCGRYDFFNNALFDISINEKFECDLKIEFDNSKYIEIFKRKLEENGFDYLTVRIYEASLFISMLPLHIDYPHKVFGFILNAINILKEIENAI